MKGTRSLLTVFLACCGAAISLWGCSGSNQVGASTQPGTVRLKVTAPASRASVTTGIVPGFDINTLTTLANNQPAVADNPSLIFNNLDLIQNLQLPAATTSGTDANSLAGLLKNAVITPMISSTTQIALILNNPDSAGSSADAIQTQVLPGAYDALRLVLNQASLQALQSLSGNSGLQVDPQTLTALVPIDGGLNVRPDETVTLLLNLATGLLQQVQ